MGIEDRIAQVDDLLSTVRAKSQRALRFCSRNARAS